MVAQLPSRLNARTRKGAREESRGSARAPGTLTLRRPSTSEGSSCAWSRSRRPRPGCGGCAGSGRCSSTPTPRSSGPL